MPARRLVWVRQSSSSTPSIRRTVRRRISWRRSVRLLSTEHSRWARRSRGSAASPAERDHGRARQRRLHLGPDRRRPIQYSASASAPRRPGARDWLAWQPTAAYGESGRAGSWVRYEIDVKSQRRLDEIGQTLWLVCDARFPGASYSAIFSLSVLPQAAVTQVSVTCRFPTESGALHGAGDWYRGAGGGRQYSRAEGTSISP